MTTEEIQKLDQAGDRAGDVELVALSRIKVDEKTNVRSFYDKIDELAAQIKDQGLLTPLTVNGNFHLIAGFRRYKALTEIIHKGDLDALVKVTVKKTDDVGQGLLLNIAENTGRENVSDYDLYQRFAMLEDDKGKYGIKRSKIASSAGMSKTAVGKAITTWNGICAKVRKAWEASEKGELVNVDGKVVKLPTVKVYEMSKKDEKIQHKMLEAFLDNDRAELEPEDDEDDEGGGGEKKKKKSGDEEVSRAPKRKEIKEFIEKLIAKKEKDGELDATDLGRYKALQWVIGELGRRTMMANE